MQNVRARFVEGQGGVIFGPGGQEAVKVNVEGMTTADAQRAVKAVIAALDAEFGQSSTSVRTGAQTAHQGGVGKVPDALAYGPAGEVT